MSFQGTADRARAVGLYEFGEPDVLSVVERPIPDLEANGVRIRVQAAAVNPTDLLFRQGTRAAILQEFAAPYVPGMDAGGAVEAVGEAVTRG